MWDWLWSNFLWEAIKWLFQPMLWAVIVSLGLSGICVKAFGVLENSRRRIWFIGLSMACLLILFSMVRAVTSPSPDLHADITFNAWGGTDRDNKINKPIGILVIRVTNRGNMASIASDWRMKAIVDNNYYDAQLIELPAILSMDIAGGHSLSFFGPDSIMDRATTPIVSGGMTTGVLLATFPSVRNDVFRDHSPEFVVTFKDVLGREYKVSHKAHSGDQIQQDMVPFTPGILQRVN